MNAWDLEAARAAFAAGDIPALGQALRTAFPSDPCLPALEQWMAFVLAGGPRPACGEARTVILAESIERTIGYLRDGRPTAPAPRGSCSRDTEFIADRNGVPSWDIPFFLNHLALSQLKPRRSAAVVVAMRDDGIYILEWVAHYRTLGFDHLFVYTNDNRDLSDPLLEQLADHGVITLIQNDITGLCEPEAKAFGHATHLLQDLRDFEWVLFVDSDEYLVPAPAYGHSVQRVLQALRQSDPEGHTAAICYDWLWLVSDMAFSREPGLLCERFQHARPHWLTKTLVRLADLLSMRCQHHAEVRPGYLVVDSAFAPIDMTQIWTRSEPNYHGGQINHYWAKSFEEFMVKKSRGATLTMKENHFNRPYQKFFTWNGHATPENYHPTDPSLIQAMHREVARLRELPGVARLADAIDGKFREFVKGLSVDGELSQIYAQHATQPGPL